MLEILSACLFSKHCLIYVLSNVNKMYDNPGEYIIRIGIIYFVQQEMHAQFS